MILIQFHFTSLKQKPYGTLFLDLLGDAEEEKITLKEWAILLASSPLWPLFCLSLTNQFDQYIIEGCIPPCPKKTEMQVRVAKFRVKMTRELN